MNELATILMMFRSEYESFRKAHLWLVQSMHILHFLHNLLTNMILYSHLMYQFRNRVSIGQTPQHTHGCLRIFRGLYSSLCGHITSGWINIQLETSNTWVYVRNLIIKTTKRSTFALNPSMGLFLLRMENHFQCGLILLEYHQALLPQIFMSGTGLKDFSLTLGGESSSLSHRVSFSPTSRSIVLTVVSRVFLIFFLKRQFFIIGYLLWFHVSSDICVDHLK